MTAITARSFTTRDGIVLAAAGVPTVVESTLLTDLEHTRLRDLCREFDVIVANTIASWPAVRAAHLEERPVLWYLHETLVAVRLIEAIPEMRSALESNGLCVGFQQELETANKYYRPDFRDRSTPFKDVRDFQSS